MMRNLLWDSPPLALLMGGADAVPAAAGGVIRVASTDGRGRQGAAPPHGSVLHEGWTVRAAANPEPATCDLLKGHPSLARHGVRR